MTPMWVSNSISVLCQSPYIVGVLWGGGGRLGEALLTHIVEDIHPALHGDALEHGEHGKQDVVKLRDAVVGPQPVLSTRRPVGTQPGRGLRPTWELLPDLTCDGRTGSGGRDEGW